MRFLITNTAATAFILGIAGGFVWMLLVFLSATSRRLGPVLLRLKSVWQIVVPVLVGLLGATSALLLLGLPSAGLITLIPAFLVSALGTAWLIARFVAWH